MNKEQFLTKGKEAEESFKQLFDDAIRSSYKEDIMDHWDIGMLVKFDVKKMKKILRSDRGPNENFHYIELKGITGHLGWLYKKADFFAFETQKYWIIVDKLKLQSWVANNIKKEMVSEPTLYKMYQRQDRKDLITLVKTLDLCYLSTSIINK